MAESPGARLSETALDALSARATGSPRLRQHFNLHDSYDDPCQRLLNAMARDSYIAPHRHDARSGVETIIALRGILACVLFDDDGRHRSVALFGDAASAIGPKLAVGVEVPPLTWHTIVMLSATGVMLELKAGPFDPAAAKFPAPFAPDEQSGEAAPYLSRLRALILAHHPRLRDTLSRLPEKI